MMSRLANINVTGNSVIITRVANGYIVTPVGDFQNAYHIQQGAVRVYEKYDIMTSALEELLHESILPE